MTKAELVSQVATEVGLDRASMNKIVTETLKAIKNNMAQGENIYLRGFGTFIVKTRAEKVARNISKNTTLVVPEHKVPSFKPAKDFFNIVK